MLQINDIAPDFTAETTEGSIHFHQWIDNKWCILFSHPSDFTPVCTTELGRVAKLQEAFEKRSCKVIAISVDDLETHKRWVQDIEETQNVKLCYPIIADPERVICWSYGMIHPGASNTMTVRSTFIIGPDKQVKLIITYPASTGRNFDEILRCLDSLQLTWERQLATPADWKQGEDCVILPTVSDEDAKKLFPKGFRRVKPYLRFTPHPETT